MTTLAEQSSPFHADGVKVEMGCRKVVDDVLSGLDKMIAGKRLGLSLAG